MLCFALHAIQSIFCCIHFGPGSRDIHSAHIAINDNVYVRNVFKEHFCLTWGSSAHILPLQLFAETVRHDHCSRFFRLSLFSALHPSLASSPLCINGCLKLCWHKYKSSQKPFWTLIQCSDFSVDLQHQKIGISLKTRINRRFFVNWLYSNHPNAFINYFNTNLDFQQRWISLIIGIKELELERASLYITIFRYTNNKCILEPRFFERFFKLFYYLVACVYDPAR